jgi:hypothetical protein
LLCFFTLSVGISIETESEEFHAIRMLLRQNEIGRTTQYMTPYGMRLICYADLTASGRFLEFVESFLACLPQFCTSLPLPYPHFVFRILINFVPPKDANSHTSISHLGQMMTDLREASRAFIARSVKAEDTHVVRKEFWIHQDQKELTRSTTAGVVCGQWSHRRVEQTGWYSRSQCGRMVGSYVSNSRPDSKRSAPHRDRALSKVFLPSIVS